jgi:hypothetical protein
MITYFLTALFIVAAVRYIIRYGIGNVRRPRGYRA